MAKVTFQHNFGGRASATRFSSVIVAGVGGKVLFTITDPSEFRVREDGRVTIYSRRHPSTSIYGKRLDGLLVFGVNREDVSALEHLTF